MTLLPEKKENGFTLIEIILTLVVVAILGAMYAQFFGTAFVQSSIPIQNIRHSFELQQVMENITTDYENDPTDLTSLRNGIVSNYVEYDPVTQFIELDDDDNSPQNILEVTIKNESGIITTLFTSQ